jgi:hypothetical protein
MAAISGRRESNRGVNAVVTVYWRGLTIESLVITRKPAGELSVGMRPASWQALQHAFASACNFTSAQFHDWVLEIAFVG